MPDETPDDIRDWHTEEARRYLAQAETAPMASPLAQLATAHFLAALLAGEPVTVHETVSADEMADCGEDCRLHRTCLVRRVDALTAALGRSAEAHEDAELRVQRLARRSGEATQRGLQLKAAFTGLVGQGMDLTERLPDPFKRALADAEKLIMGEAVPSTGEDRSEVEVGVTDLLGALEDSVTKARAARKTECERGCDDNEADAACPKHGVAAFLGGRPSDEEARSDDE